MIPAPEAISIYSLATQMGANPVPVKRMEPSMGILHVVTLGFVHARPMLLVSFGIKCFVFVFFHPLLAF